MSNSYFRFKQFVIEQDATAMKVGTDGVLLGAIADLQQARTVLDIGTGTGLIALMVKQRNPQLQVTAIDIEPNAVRQARSNIAQSPWDVEVIETSAQQLGHSGRVFDLIVCNPPYFTQSLKAPDAARTLARHNDSLPFDELLQSADNLLAPDGRFWVILPHNDAPLFAEKANKIQLYVTQHITIQSKAGKAPKRSILCIGRTPQPTRRQTLLLERQEGGYTDTFATLVRNFYLDKNLQQHTNP